MTCTQNTLWKCHMHLLYQSVLLMPSHGANTRSNVWTPHSSYSHIRMCPDLSLKAILGIQAKRKSFCSRKSLSLGPGQLKSTISVTHESKSHHILYSGLLDNWFLGHYIWCECKVWLNYRDANFHFYREANKNITSLDPTLSSIIPYLHS
jgi:hypothetical protein